MKKLTIISNPPSRTPQTQFKKPQLRMDSFFGAVKAPNAEALSKKRQAEKDAKKKGGKKQKTTAQKKNFFGKK